jgi:nucleoid DNA-binding protein
MSTKLVISERVIIQVIAHQFDSANDALKNNNSVEISGFGKFVFNKKRAVAKIKKLTDVKNSYEKMLEDDELPVRKVNFIKNKLSSINLTLGSLKPKVEEDHETI